ncbi:SDR family NAD(P)-dependent oxidoreductase [Curvivirga aplysinae]|uniref:SDR family NAD(P)-dependent oxidoreductase n=1 Tax=Curvivirga aplysinae TaxID=2529852 RepID=UPI0012BCA58F|nr:SDR family NAD(P)-dependent oxidoreductase [Curvivirga aplysinae]MTI08889.1 SDR family NAD(P)-dependent oxidoreductase [Curvivirga aplysinae]
MTQTKPHALITGGNGAIGAALARKLIQKGYRVTITGRDEKKLAAISETHPDMKHLVCDVTDPAATEKMIETSFPVDLAILNAGTYQPGQTSQTTLETFKHMMDVNYFGVINCLIPLIKHMKQHSGHIAIVGSLAGYIGLPNASGYGASKAAIINLCESLKAELQDSLVRIQLISPGFVKSKLTDKNNFDMPELLEPEEAANFIMEGLDNNRFEISFPKKFASKMKFLRILPYSAYFSLIKKVTK